MAGIAAIYHLDHEPVQPDLVRRLRLAIAHRGPDGTSGRVDGSVGLAHAAFQTTPESMGERQPLVDEARGLRLVFDGRIDNREELVTALRGYATDGTPPSDAELVLRAYARWGEACPEHLLGDFAFAVWDQRNQRLFCARDIVGVKPFYYTTVGRTFACGSTVGTLLQVPGVRLEPNEGIVGEFLANAIRSQKDTLLSGIMRLPAAHALSVQPGRVRKWRYWDVDTTTSIRYPTNEQYQEHLLSLLENAVQCRLRGHVGAELSGGLDSSAVVAVAQSLLGKDRRLQSFSIVFPGMRCDETKFSAAVAAKCGLEANRSEPYLAEPSIYIEEARRHLDFPGYPNTHMSRSLKKLARQRGCSVLLTGCGGDEWFSGSLYRYADHVRRLQFVSLARQVQTDYGTLASRPALNSVLRFGLLPLVGGPIRRRLRALRHRDTTPPFVDPRLAARVHLKDRTGLRPSAHRFSDLAQRDVYGTLRSGEWSHANEVEERVTTTLGIEHRHPFFDRRLIEFAMAIPENQRWRDGLQKQVLRRSLRGRLPASVLDRRDKSEFSMVFDESFAQHGGDGLFDRLEIAQRGWVDGRRAREAYQQMFRQHTAAGTPDAPDVWHLWQVYGLELWHRALFSNNQRSPELPQP